MSLSQTLDDLALLYLATIQALAVSPPLFILRSLFCCICFPHWILLRFQLGTRHILEAMKEAGHDIQTIFLCGGLSKNSLFVQTHANATGTKSKRDKRPRRAPMIVRIIEKGKLLKMNTGDGRIQTNVAVFAASGNTSKRKADIVISCLIFIF